MILPPAEDALATAKFPVQPWDLMISGRHLLPICLALLLCQTITTADEPTAKRVLLIHSFGRDFAPFDALASRFRKQLAQTSQQRIEFLDASLEMARFDGAENDAPLLEFLAAIFQTSPPDLIVPIGAPAAHFIRRHRAHLYPNTPLLLAGLDARRLDADSPPENAVIAAFDMDLAALLGNILSLLPQTREVYVAMGAAPLEQFWVEEIKKAWSIYDDRVAVHYLNNLSVEQMKSSLSNLAPNAVIFHGIINRDALGIPYESEDALEELAAVTNAPVFGYNESQLGMGIIGGPLLAIQESADQAADAAERLLAGEKTSSIRLQPLPLTSPRYDSRQLQRFSIPESALPPGSMVLFREPSLWQSHGGWVLAVTTVGLLQAGLIAMLLAARRRARESAASLALAAESVGMGVWQRDTATDEIIASPEWRRLFGLHSKDPITLSEVIERIPPAERQNLIRSIEHGNQKGQRYLVEHQINLPDGSSRWIASIGRAESPGPAGHHRTRGISIDITERKRIEKEFAQQRDQLAHLSRVTSLGELSGSLAHELNQPLGAILSNAQTALHLTARAGTDMTEIREILVDIIDADNRAGDVIRRLRALVQPGETPEFKTLSLQDCVEDVLRLMRSDLVDRSVTVETHFASSPPVSGDPVQLQQVLINLLMNACDAMAAIPAVDRTIQVSLYEEDGNALLKIQDHGPGLPEKPEQLFKPFHTTKKNGLGIGLAICRSIVEGHQGRLWATPCQDGFGAVFQLQLPAA